MPIEYGRKPKKVKMTLLEKQKKIEEEQMYKMRKDRWYGTAKKD